MDKGTLSKQFDDASTPPATPFIKFLRETFEDEATVKNVIDAFDNMGLPLPETEGEFLKGTQGPVVFVNKYGVAIRIERKEPHEGENEFSPGNIPFDRVDNSPWVIQPLGSIDVGAGIIEICPGCKPETESDSGYTLYKNLNREGVNFWDRSTANVGLVPIKTPSFPLGVPVVIDRLAVVRLSGEAGKVLEALRKASGITRRTEARTKEANELQEKIYGPLKESFSASWGDKEKMKAFWALCMQASKDGVLVAGWNTKEKDTRKQYIAEDVAWGYQEKMMRAEGKRFSSFSRVTRQSLRQ